MALAKSILADPPTRPILRRNDIALLSPFFPSCVSRSGVVRDGLHWGRWNAFVDDVSNITRREFFIFHSFSFEFGLQFDSFLQAMAQHSNSYYEMTKLRCICLFYSLSLVEVNRSLSRLRMYSLPILIAKKRGKILQFTVSSFARRNRKNDLTSRVSVPRLGAVRRSPSITKHLTERAAQNT